MLVQDGTFEAAEKQAGPSSEVETSDRDPRSGYREVITEATLDGQDGQGELLRTR